MVLCKYILYIYITNDGYHSTLENSELIKTWIRFQAFSRLSLVSTAGLGEGVAISISIGSVSTFQGRMKQLQNSNLARINSQNHQT